MDNSIYKCINIWEDDYIHVFINGTPALLSNVVKLQDMDTGWQYDSVRQREVLHVCDCLQCVGAHGCHVTIQLCMHNFQHTIHIRNE